MVTKKKNYIVFTGGGTGGHIYPGLGIADELRALCPSIKIVWIGAAAGMDKNLVEKSGSVDVFRGIPSGKLRRYFSIKNFIDLFKIIAGFFVALYILQKYRPIALFSKGGFVSVPPCMAAKLLKIPIYTHECDYSPGLATRINARVAKKILVSFNKTKSFFNKETQKKVVITGNPVRPVFYTADAQKGKDFLNIQTTKPILLVLGGSLGAQQINNLVFNSLEWLCNHFIVVHQTGKGQFFEATELAKKIKTNKESYKPYAFFYSEMPDVMACADVVLSRAGSNFLWECAVTQKPLVLVPLCGSGTRGDQVENANYFAENKAAIVLNENDVDFAHLTQALEKLLDAKQRQIFSDNIKKLVSNSKPALEIAKILQAEVSSI